MVDCLVGHHHGLFNVKFITDLLTLSMNEISHWVQDKIVIFFIQMPPCGPHILHDCLPHRICFQMTYVQLI